MFAGFLTVVFLSLATDVVLHIAGVFPPWGQPVSDAPLLFTTAYRTVYAGAKLYEIRSRPRQI